MFWTLTFTQVAQNKASRFHRLSLKKVALVLFSGVQKLDGGIQNFGAKIDNVQDTLLEEPFILGSSVRSAGGKIVRILVGP